MKEGIHVNCNVIAVYTEFKDFCFPFCDVFSGKTRKKYCVGSQSS